MALAEVVALRGSQALPLFRTQTALTHDGAYYWERNIAGVHGNGDTTTVGVHVSGMAATLAAEHEARVLEFPDDLSGSKRSKRHGEEALRAGRTPLPPSPP
jgi:hypothetical protein